MLQYTQQLRTPIISSLLTMKLVLISAIFAILGVNAQVKRTIIQTNCWLLNLIDF